jgi:hypothetical protein
MGKALRLSDAIKLKSRAPGNQGIPDFLLRNPRGKCVVERDKLGERMSRVE